MKQEAIGRCLGAAVLAAVPMGLLAQGQGVGPARPFSFAAIGDAPYEPTISLQEPGKAAALYQKYPVPAYDTLISKINSDTDLEFTVHIGDIKAGNTQCFDDGTPFVGENGPRDVYKENLKYFNTFNKPLIFSIGDNEWTDCHRANNGGYDPVGRLALIRATFFTNNKSLGVNTIPLTKDKAPYVENAAWTIKPALFISLHMPGSNNNRGRTTGIYTDNDNEYTGRNESNMAFLEDQLKKATLDPQIKLVVIASQANPFERFLEAGFGTQSGYADFVEKIRAWVVANPEKRMLYVHGDTHTPRFSHPLTPVYPSPSQLSAAGVPYTNFSRLEVYAQTAAFTNYFKVNVEPDGNFTVAPVTLP